MDLTLMLEHVFTRTPDGRVWSGPTYSSRVFSRYLAVFSHVHVVARLREAPVPAPGCVAADGPGIMHHQLAPYRGAVGFLRHRGQLIRDLAAIPQTGAVILRLPSPIAEVAFRHAGLDMRPFGVELVGDPWEAFSFTALRHPLAPWLRWRYRRSTGRLIAAACAASYVTGSTLQQRYPVSSGVPTFSISSVDLPDEAFVEAIPDQRGSGPFNLVFVGSLEQRYKGVDVLLDAMAIIRRSHGIVIRLHIVGDGRLLSNYQRQSERLGISDRIVWHGRLPGGQPVRDICDRSDLMVLPSRTEGLSRAVIEGMARGLPCIVTRVGGMPEILDDSQLVAPGDAVAMAQAIVGKLGDVAARQRDAQRNLAQAHAFAHGVLQERRIAFYRAIVQCTISGDRQG